MDQATDCLPSITAIHDDICTFGHTPEEHVMNTSCAWCSQLKTMELSLIVKCHTRQPQIAFYGAVFTAQGMQLDPSKIQALQDFPTPDSQTKLQSFLGLFNYLQPFITGLSTKTKFLHEQLTDWDWHPSTDPAF